MNKQRLVSIARYFVFAIALLSTSTAFASDTARGKLEIDDSTFKCLSSMTPVRDFYVDNLLGDLDKTLEIAKSPTGGKYPAGSVVQLIPGEVMVKLEEGSFPATKDWEFFELEVSKEGGKIQKRGFVDVVNKFGGNCFACHIQARPEWDLICEKGHGCDPLDLTQEMISAIQKTDPRCEDSPELNDSEKKALQDLMKALAGTQQPAG
ncbi:MAG: hypothetical protein ACI9FR_001446 [Cryomorphaceae bacterium]|jgi:hypothetical protein